MKYHVVTNRMKKEKFSQCFFVVVVVVALHVDGEKMIYLKRVKMSD
jgi:hypothetical protein